MWRILLFILLFYSVSVVADEWAYERELFVKVENDLKRGARASYIKHQNSLKKYPLYPYLVYQDYKRRISRIKDTDILTFLEHHKNSIMADKLRHRWLKNRATKGRWDIVAEHYIASPYVNDRSLKCHYARALLGHNRTEEARDVILDLWLVSYSQNANCDYVFKEAKRRKIIGDEEIWQRILLVLPKRKGLANYLSKSLSKESKKSYRTLTQAQRNPLKLLSQIREQALVSSKYRDSLLFALQREQRKNGYRASQLWNGLYPKLKNYPAFRTLAGQRLGLRAAQSLESEIAYKYLKNVPASIRKDESHFWLIRSALRLGNWRDVISAIGEMPSHLRTYPQWRYWKARALAQTKKLNEAQVIWGELSQRGDYYGYLSADRINAKYKLKQPQYDSSSLDQINELQQVKRIQEFLKLNRIFDARREMNYLTNELTSEDRIKLALLCRRWDWSSGVIQAMSSDYFRGETDLRFPIAYKDLVEREAQRSQIPMHWIYGVIRRESAFMPKIKSPAGAIGLMQLMPRTAKSVARKLRMRRPSKAQLTNPTLNLRLGSAYIKRLYKKNNNHLPLSLAAYNAGPSRVKKWLRETPVRDPEVWIDTIPFDETRLYVRAVLFYMTVYQYKLEGRADRLRRFLSI